MWYNLSMDDRIGNVKSQIEHLKGGLSAFEGESATELKAAIANAEKALFELETALLAI